MIFAFQAFAGDRELKSSRFQIKQAGISSEPVDRRALPNFGEIEARGLVVISKIDSFFLQLPVIVS